MRNRYWFGTLSAILLLIMALTLSSATAKPKPYVVRTNLAGVNLNDVRRYPFRDRYDPKNKYYLLSGGDCDGSRVELMLTPDPTLLDGWGEGNFLLHTSLPRLKSGSGVNIGDSPATVRAKLGRRPNVIRPNNKNRSSTHIYQQVVASKWGQGHDDQYTARYIFKNNRLWAISYELSQIEGC